MYTIGKHNLATRATKMILVSSMFLFSSISAHASSIPMVFDFFDKDGVDKVEFSGVFSYDDTSEITFTSHPGITAFSVDSLLVTYTPTTGGPSRWDQDEVSSATGALSIFFDNFGGAAIGSTDGTIPSFDTTYVAFIDSMNLFGTDELLEFSSSFNETLNGWEVVQGVTRADVGGATDRAYYTVSAVPLPAAAWLFGSGLIGLLGFARRKS